MNKILSSLTAIFCTIFVTNNAFAKSEVTIKVHHSLDNVSYDAVHRRNLNNESTTRWVKDGEIIYKSEQEGSFLDVDVRHTSEIDNTHIRLHILEENNPDKDEKFNHKNVRVGGSFFSPRKIYIHYTGKGHMFYQATPVYSYQCHKSGQLVPLTMRINGTAIYPDYDNQKEYKFKFKTYDTFFTDGALINRTARIYIKLSCEI